MGVTISERRGNTESAGTVVLCGFGQTPDLSPPSFPRKRESTGSRKGGPSRGGVAIHPDLVLQVGLPGTCVGSTSAALAVWAVATSAIVPTATARSQTANHMSGVRLRVFATLSFPLVCLNLACWGSNRSNDGRCPSCYATRRSCQVIRSFRRDCGNLSPPLVSRFLFQPCRELRSKK